MSKTLLDTIKAVTGELGFVQPSVAMSSQELTTIQLRYLLVAACDELLDLHDWQALITQGSITTNGTLSYELPADFHRMVNGTTWNSQTSSTMNGSASNRTWQQHVSNNDREKFRVIGNRLHLATATTDEVITFDYITSKYVIDGTNGLSKLEFSLDSDQTVYHARLLINFLKLKFLQTKSLDTRAAVEDFNASLETAIGADSPSSTLTTESPYATVSYDTEY